MFLKGYPLEAKTAPKNWNQSVHISWARPASFCHLDIISDPLIVSKFHNKTHDPKGQENKIYTIQVHYKNYFTTQYFKSFFTFLLYTQQKKLRKSQKTMQHNNTKGNNYSIFIYLFRYMSSVEKNVNLSLLAPIS